MTFATICMGYDYGFHLYGLSLIAVAFYLYYLSSKDKTAKRFNPFISSIIIICFYILCIVVTNHMEPLYVLNKTVSSIFLGVNSFFVFSFVVFYMNEFLKLVFDSEKKLEHVAHHDNLTGLYNRSYMMDSMIGSLPDDKSDYWVAMADIDNFKKINDTYGHNGGDEVLMTVARTINDVCSKCIVCRWGGEEFLIIGNSKEDNSDVLEKLRETIYKNEVVYHNQNIKVSVTIGVAEYDNDKNIDAWIQRADEKLYFGKENGKNRVVK